MSNFMRTEPESIGLLWNIKTIEDAVSDELDDDDLEEPTPTLVPIEHLEEVQAKPIPETSQ